MASSTMRTPDQIWADDLFERKEEAAQIIAYLESVVGRPAVREDKSAYTLSIDARYGEGKTFFLKRLAENLAINHPVAFVDAWADDLADEPLIALAATLREALKPYANAPLMEPKVKQFISKAGAVAKLSSIGIMKRLLILAMTQGTVGEIEALFDDLSEADSDQLADDVKTVAQGASDDAAAAIKNVDANRLMYKQISEFEDGKRAVQEMKESLRSIVDALSNSSVDAPIIIVIDELDRCRPTYAIKLLEEIKHLFDVPGLVFIFAVHADQLAHSVSGAYGSGFDGEAYLRRFIDREYRLAMPSRRLLLDVLCSKANLTLNSFWQLPITGVRRSDGPVGLPGLLAQYLASYDCSARDAFAVVDMLQTCVALQGSSPLYLPYLLPLIIEKINPPKDQARLKPSSTSSWKYMPNFNQRLNHGDTTEYGFHETFEAMEEAVQFTPEQMRRIDPETSGLSFAVRIATNQYVDHEGQQGISTVWGYRRLIETVGRFENPTIAPPQG